MVRLLSFLFAGFFAGVSGVLFALFSRYASAHFLFWTVSGEGVVWAIVGGVRTVCGPTRSRRPPPTPPPTATARKPGDDRARAQGGRADQDVRRAGRRRSRRFH